MGVAVSGFMLVLTTKPRETGALLLEKKEDGALARPALRSAIRKEKA